MTSNDESGRVSRVIQCPCGQELRGDDIDQLIADAQAHARENHGMQLSDDEARSMARPA